MFLQQDQNSPMHCFGSNPLHFTESIEINYFKHPIVMKYCYCYHYYYYFSVCGMDFCYKRSVVDLALVGRWEGVAALATQQ